MEEPGKKCRRVEKRGDLIFGVSTVFFCCAEYCFVIVGELDQIDFFDFVVQGLYFFPIFCIIDVQNLVVAADDSWPVIWKIDAIYLLFLNGQTSKLINAEAGSCSRGELLALMSQSRIFSVHWEPRTWCTKDGTEYDRAKWVWQRLTWSLKILAVTKVLSRSAVSSMTCSSSMLESLI